MRRKATLRLVDLTIPTIPVKIVSYWDPLNTLAARVKKNKIIPIQ